jgi:hypothetical protein
MPHPFPKSARQRLHQRSIVLSGYLRDDGLLEVEARLTDVKDRDYEIASGLRPAGVPIHDMWVRVALDEDFAIVAAEACSEGVPYPGACEAIAPDYHRIVGLNLLRGFRKTVGEMFANVQGCSHLTELLFSLPTAAIQTVATLRRDTDDSQGKPFQLDRCHALDTRSPTVMAYYPRWYRADRA